MAVDNAGSGSKFRFFWGPARPPADKTRRVPAPPFSLTSCTAAGRPARTAARSRATVGGFWNEAREDVIAIHTPPEEIKAELERRWAWGGFRLELARWQSFEALRIGLAEITLLASSRRRLPGGFWLPGGFVRVALLVRSFAGWQGAAQRGPKLMGFCENPSRSGISCSACRLGIWIL